MNCILLDDDKLAREVLGQLISLHPDLELLQSFERPSDALAYLKKNEVDLLFLDVEMPEMSGLEFLELMGSKAPNVILTTSHEKFAVEAFKYKVSGYLVKPVKFDAFSQAVKKVQVESMAKQPEWSFNNNLLFIKEGKTITKIRQSDVSLIECIGDYVNLFVKDQKYTVHATMKEMEQRFSLPEYLRVHRSFIIRLDAIEDIEDDSIAFGKRLIPIGKTYKQAVYSHLNIL